MKFSLKTIAAAAVLAAASAGASAAIDAGATGNGELFFSAWDANGSYTRDLNITINSFETQLAASGSIDLSFAKDATFTSFLAGADAATLKWNLVAADTVNPLRLLTTYTTTVVTSDLLTKSALTNVRNFATAVNGVIGANDSVMVNSGSAAYAGSNAAGKFGTNLGGLMPFSNAGTLASDSFASGLNFMRVNALSTGQANSVFNQYMDGSEVKVYLDAGKTLHIAAAAPVPEPESYAMLLAGLGMIGFMAGRRNKRA